MMAFNGRNNPSAVSNGIMLEDICEDTLVKPGTVITYYDQENRPVMTETIPIDPICANCVNQTTITCGTCHDHVDFEAIEPVEPDNVNHPQHYTAGGIECIEAIRAALTAEEFRGYCKGNILKYIWRERMKGQDESVKKAIWYAKQMTEVGK